MLTPNPRGEDLTLGELLFHVMGDRFSPFVVSRNAIQPLHPTVSKIEFAAVDRLRTKGLSVYRVEVIAPDYQVTRFMELWRRAA